MLNFFGGIENYVKELVGKLACHKSQGFGIGCKLLLWDVRLELLGEFKDLHLFFALYLINLYECFDF